MRVQQRSGAAGSSPGSRGRISKPTKKPRDHKSIPKKLAAPYTVATYPVERTVDFALTKDWDASRLVAATRKIVFGDQFEAREYVSLGPLYDTEVNVLIFEAVQISKQ